MDTQLGGTADHGARPLVGIIGGSGMYQLPGSRTLRTQWVDTPFGATSAPVTVAELNGRVVAFLPRHGGGHKVPPQQINYRANIWALASLGVRAVISSAAVGSLAATQPRDSFSVVSDFFDRTWGRADSFYDGSTEAGVQHLPAAEAYCENLRGALLASLRDLAEPHQDGGVVAVINGPRFTSPAESDWLASAGAELVSMTQYPEPVLAAELNLGFATLAYITDSDTGHDGSEPVTAELVFHRLRAAQSRVAAVLAQVLDKLDDDYRPEPRINPEAVQAVLAAPVVVSGRSAPEAD
ncbi:MTAP family purine nucleoside phosphorylase [Arthrobacter russicus]|jgi:5'-methylthioadenosine phosphorylase|uniref:Purine nucleoside phosphorylase n=1 Tax=Arthrobacter russicus TaxID=172040 RepID=A0ABU1JF54_9MICC|nr:MTAP family purine nucleoside phosphorylase [Arthrobacter russicus]MDR6270760.1 5'-methylthioadenosine phosphorylase [Arthrobacter russicus]